jgi:peptide chain release factor 1
MQDRLHALEQEYADLERRLADPAVTGDNRRYVELSRRYAELGDVVAVIVRQRTLDGDLAAARSLVAEVDGTEREELRAEIADIEREQVRLADELRLLLLPKDPDAGRNVIVEIRGAEGGEEANLFARDLFEMYRAFAARQGWTVQVLSSQVSDLGGFDSVTFVVGGPGAWTHLKHEAGPHRVQRVPVTESQGRVHTSSATVTVLPEADEVEVVIDPNDLQVDTYRSSGAGGQHVNTTDSAVRITHRPTGLVVSMQDEKSQLQNRERALQVLRARLKQLEDERRQSEQSATRRGQTGGGGRSEKVRTYNFKENRVTDHRIGMTVHKLDRVLTGELDEISAALVREERTRQLAEEEPVG